MNSDAAPVPVHYRIVESFTVIFFSKLPDINLLRPHVRSILNGNGIGGVDLFRDLVQVVAAPSKKRDHLRNVIHIKPDGIAIHGRFPKIGDAVPDVAL